MIPLTKPYFSNQKLKKISRNIKNILSNGNLINGKWTKAFEKSFIKLVGTKHALTTNTCTTAIQICLSFFNARDHDILVPSGSFQTNISAIRWAGANPILVDMDPKTLTFSLDDLRSKITKKTKGIIWVHVTGYISPEYKKIVNFAKKNNLFIIEDCAHAHGASINNKMAGTFGDAGCFSFYPSKILTTGTGGMITTNNSRLANYAKRMRFLGRNLNGKGVSLEGNDWFMDEVRSCIGFFQMQDLKNILVKRNSIAKIYNKYFENNKKIRILENNKSTKSSYYQYPIFIKNLRIRDKLVKVLNKKYKIASKKIWLPTHQEKIFKNIKFNRRTLKKTEKTFASSICLPIFASLTEKKAKYIAKIVLSSISKL